MDLERIEELKAAGIDYDAGVDRFGGNVAMFEKFVLRFTSDTHYEELLKALADEDCETAYRIAHTLKGVVGNLSFSEYLETLTSFTELLHEEKLSEAKAMLSQLTQIHERVLRALEKVSQ